MTDNYRTLRGACAARAKEWEDKATEKPTLMYWTVGLAGEVGEACNVSTEFRSTGSAGRRTDSRSIRSINRAMFNLNSW